MKIHFVCSGNTNRSRMAEAYCNSKQVPGIVATSSGIYADQNLNEDLCWYAKEILEEEGIVQYTTPTWTKTTLEILEKNDCIICMQEEHYNFIQQKLKYKPQRFEIWNIPDIQSPGFFETQKNKAKKLEADRNIFKMIQEKVDIFLESLA